MFSALVYEYSSAEYEPLVLLIDEDGFEEKTDYSSYFAEHGFTVIRYENDLVYRSEIEELAKSRQKKLLMIAKPDVYIPYDVQKLFRTTHLSLVKLFPKLNINAIYDNNEEDYDLLTLAYKTNYDDLREYKATNDFLREIVHGNENVKKYVETLCRELNKLIENAKKYSDWFVIAEKKAKIYVLAAQCGILKDIEKNIDEKCQPFIDYIQEKFGELYWEIAEDTPVIVSRAMDYMHEHSRKFVIIVMDGMSEFDWKIISKSFDGIKYSHSQAMAMIPTVTSISRQCLLSNKLPKDLENPWSQSKEKKEFTDCALSLGYLDSQIAYERGYDAEFSLGVSCAAIIINDVDDLVHGQKHGRTGMYLDIPLLMDKGKLVETVKNMLKAGFDVYISSDHGNTPCTGIGKLMKTGVETETKSHRMTVLKDFADKGAILEKYPELIDYKKYYLDKQFEYLICGIGKSFDAKGEEVMNHGGITIDEVIVPFITIKAVDNND